MRIIVQKFGGTSVDSAQKRSLVCQKVAAAIEQGYSPVVVVSAMGRRGDPYATDTLVSLAREAGSLLDARNQDLLMSCGEVISSVVMASALRGLGYESRALTGIQAGILTDNHFGEANCIDVNINHLSKLLSEGIIPVVAGFQGGSMAGEITTLGRGGSDTTAVILAGALKAEFVEIYTDVDGIMTADPRLLQEAKVLEEISYAEVFQMADLGAKVIHPRAVELAMQSNLPVIVRNTMSDSPGTRISGQVNHATYQGDILTSIAHMSDRTQISIEDFEEDSQPDILSMLADAGVSIDLINIFPRSMLFTVSSQDTAVTEEILSHLQGSYLVRPNCAKVSAVGGRMRGVPGVMSRIIHALTHEGVAVLQTADSHMTISCLVDSADTQRAVRALHEEFHLN